MTRSNIVALKPEKQQEADRKDTLGDLEHIESELRILTYAVSGMAHELGDVEEANGIVNRLRDVIDRIDAAFWKLSPHDRKATRRNLRRAEQVTS